MMPTFETLPRFERDWKKLSEQQKATFRKVVTEVFVPDLAAPDRPFRPGLRVKGVTARPGVLEMTWDSDGRGRPRSTCSPSTPSLLQTACSFPCRRNTSP